ncbi:MAG: GNAT family N-acetyltransferase [Actinomycetes bacterium]
MTTPAPRPDRLPVEGRIRPVTDADADALTALVGAAYAEHPGCVLDLPGVDADLTAPRRTFDARGGDLWVVEDADGGVVACGGWKPATVDGEPAVELSRLYVAARARRRGLAAWLVGQVERVGRERGAALVTLWSDTRFADAHRLYERLGYERQPGTRELHDPSDTTEYEFRRRL